MHCFCIVLVWGHPLPSLRHAINNDRSLILCHLFCAILVFRIWPLLNELCCQERKSTHKDSMLIWFKEKQLLGGSESYTPKRQILPQLNSKIQETIFFNALTHFYCSFIS